MKKFLSMIITFLVIAILATTVVNATTSATLADELYALGSKYGMTSADKIKIERYLADNTVTDEQANAVMEKAREAAKIMDDAGETNVNELTKDQKNQLKSKANEAASILGLTLTFKSGTVEVYKNGKLIETLGVNNSGKLVYTGNNTNAILVVSSIVAVALTAGFVARKKFANA